MSAQSMQALAKANRVRTEGMAVRREVAELPRRDGLERMAELILDPPPALLSVRVDWLLKGVRGVGNHLAARMLNEAWIRPTHRREHLRHLCATERVRLARVLRQFR